MAKFPGFSLKAVSHHPEMYFYLEQARRFKTMTREEEYAVHRRICSGGPDSRAALEEFTNRNLKLVISVALKYTGLGLPTPDLMQEGNLGLLRAINKFEPDFGFKFSTYATWWIRQAIIRALHGSGIIKIPSFMVTAKHQVPKVERYIGHAASDLELSEFIGMPLPSASRLRSLPEVTDSIHAPMWSGTGEVDNDFTLLDALSDGRLYESELLDQINCSQVLLNTRAILEGFCPRDAEIIRLWSSEGTTLQSIADTLDLSRERVRQIIFTTIADIRFRMGLAAPRRGRPRAKRIGVSADSDVGKGEV